MGVNNRARRAAKRRKEHHGRRDLRNPSSPPAGSGHATASHEDDARSRLLRTLRLLQIVPGRAAERAQQFLAADDADAAITELHCVLGELSRTVAQRHWTHTDLVEIIRRRLSTRHLPLVEALSATPHVDNVPDMASAAGFQIGLEVAALLQTLPPIADVTSSPRSSAAGGGSEASSAVLAKVRALLAKAESTEFPAEAEALSAKAQQLIATYALDRYAAHLDQPGHDPSMAVRRLWIDPPYVDAKAMLVDAVAGANHCRSVLSSYLGFVTLVGQVADIEATELLVTSLQVQADGAMLRHGRIEVRPGESRTRSFRKSFLVSYASRIRERLRHAADETLETSGRSTELVPVLARSEERVRIVTEELFPEIKMRRTTISNREGWVAGRAAADLARFDHRDHLTRKAAGQ